MIKGLRNWKILPGLVFAGVCLFLAFHKVDFVQMAEAFRRIDPWMLLPILGVIFFSHWLRTVRWQYLLKPVAHIDLKTLFSALLIGYMANSFLPAHLGEVVRAYMVARRRPVPAGAVFAGIVIERILDVFTLLLLMALTVVVFPFPDWVRKSGLISFVVILLLFMLLITMKKHRRAAMSVTERLLTPLPTGARSSLVRMLHSFLDGVAALQRRRDYLIVAALSLAIWFCYGYVFQLGLQAFGFQRLYSLPWTAPLVLLVITTIAVAVPSSPGYVGTYHYLCQLSLGLFGVPPGDALTFAFVIHGINFLPILLVGLAILSTMKLSLKTVQQQAEQFGHKGEAQHR